MVVGVMLMMVTWMRLFSISSRKKTRLWFVGFEIKNLGVEKAKSDLQKNVFFLKQEEEKTKEGTYQGVEKASTK